MPNAILSLTPRRVQLLEDVALVTSHATVTTPDGEVGEMTTEIMRRQHNGHWLYIYDDSHSAAYSKTPPHAVVPIPNTTPPSSTTTVVQATLEMSRNHGDS